MGYVLDGVIAGICLIFVLVGVHRGFIRSVVHFLGSIIAAVLASVLGGALAKWVFDALFRAAMVEKIHTTVLALGADNASGAAQQIIASLPDSLVRALEQAGVTAETISGGVKAQSAQAASMIVDYISPVFVGFLKVLAVIVLFSLLMTVVRLLASVVSGLLHLPVLGQVDGLLGGVFGFLLAIFVVWVVIAAVLVFQPMLDQNTQYQVESALSSSLIVGKFVSMNPLGGLFG